MAMLPLNQQLPATNLRMNQIKIAQNPSNQSTLQSMRAPV